MKKILINHSIFLCLYFAVLSTPIFAYSKNLTLPELDDQEDLINLKVLSDLTSLTEEPEIFKEVIFLKEENLRINNEIYVSCNYKSLDSAGHVVSSGKNGSIHIFNSTSVSMPTGFDITVGGYYDDVVVDINTEVLKNAFKLFPSEAYKNENLSVQINIYNEKFRLEVADKNFSDIPLKLFSYKTDKKSFLYFQLEAEVNSAVTTFGVCKKLTFDNFLKE